MLMTRGFVDLTKVLFFLGDTQLKIICFVSAVGLFITVGVTCYNVSERVLIHPGYNIYFNLPTILVFNLGNLRHCYLYWFRYGIESCTCRLGLEQFLEYNFLCL